jgi:hypothetical protein
VKPGTVEHEEAAAMKWHGKHVSVETDTDATIEVVVFSVRSMPRLYNEEKQQQTVGLSREDGDQEEIDAEIKTGLEEVKVMGLEANPEEIEAIAEQQEVPNKEATIGAPED